jgi:hypothetical protein
MLKTDIQKKTEKIASAAYLVTGYFDDKEPLKWKLRTLSSELVSKSLYQKDISNILREVLSLFTVAKNAGLVTEMNHGIISRELEKLLEADASDSVAALFYPVGQTVESEPARISEANEPRETAQTIKDRSYPALIAERPMPRAERREEEPKEKNLKEFGAVAIKKNSRQSVIIGLLKRKKEIMIRDVSPLIEGVSEKTIQRELLTMVSQGILKKMGEKRWSRYTLAN